MRNKIAKEILNRPKPKIKVKFYWFAQFGLMFSVGTNFERRAYLSIDLPFCSIQILGPEKVITNDKSK